MLNSQINEHKKEEVNNEKQRDREDDDEEMQRKQSIVTRRRVQLFRDYLDELDDHVRVLITHLGYGESTPSRQEINLDSKSSSHETVVSKALSRDILLRNYSKSGVNSSEILTDISGEKRVSYVKRFHEMIDRGSVFVSKDLDLKVRIKVPRYEDSWTALEEQPEDCDSQETIRSLQDEVRRMSVYEESLRSSVSSLHCLEIELRKLLEEKRRWVDEWVPAIFSQVAKQMDRKKAKTIKLLSYLIEIIGIKSVSAIDVNRRLSKRLKTSSPERLSLVSTQEVMYVVVYRCLKLKEILQAAKLHSKF